MEIAYRVKDNVQRWVDAGKIQYAEKKVQTAIVQANPFYPAHEEHQAYLEKNPLGYCNHFIRFRMSSLKEEERVDTKLAPFNPSSETAQLQSIAMMNLKSDDVLFDLGCGDARLLIRAVSLIEGLRCVGVEIDPIFVERANNAISELSSDVQERIQIRCEDVTKVLRDVGSVSEQPNAPHATENVQELSIMDATVIYLYLLPRGLRQIKETLDNLVKARLQTGNSLRVVAYTFSVPEWEPAKVDTSTKSGVPIYLYEFSSEETCETNE